MLIIGILELTSIKVQIDTLEKIKKIWHVYFSKRGGGPKEKSNCQEILSNNRHRVKQFLVIDRHICAKK